MTRKTHVGIGFIALLSAACSGGGLSLSSSCSDLLASDTPTQRDAVRDLGLSIDWELAGTNDAHARVVSSCLAADRDPSNTPLEEILTIQRDLTDPPDFEESAPGAPDESVRAGALHGPIEASVELENWAGYTYQLDFHVWVDDVTVDVANAPPGEAALTVFPSGTLKLTNTTPGRNLGGRVVLVGLQLQYIGQDFASAGYGGCDNPNDACISFPTLVPERSTRVYDAHGSTYPTLPEGESVTFTIDVAQIPFANPRVTSEDKIEVAADLFRGGLAPRLMLRHTDDNAKALSCTNIVVRRDSSGLPDNDCP